MRCCSGSSRVCPLPVWPLPDTDSCFVQLLSLLMPLLSGAIAPLFLAGCYGKNGQLVVGELVEYSIEKKHNQLALRAEKLTRRTRVLPVGRKLCCTACSPTARPVLPAGPGRLLCLSILETYIAVKLLPLLCSTRSSGCAPWGLSLIHI